MHSIKGNYRPAINILGKSIANAAPGLGFKVLKSSQNTFSNLDRNYSTERFLSSDTKELLGQLSSDLVALTKARDFDGIQATHERIAEAASNSIKREDMRTTFVLRDTSWFLSNLCRLLMQYRTTSEHSSLLDAMAPAYKGRLLLDITRRFRQLDESTQVRLIAMTEPGVMSRLLAENRVIVDSNVLVKAEQLRQQCDTQLNENELLAMYDSRNGGSATFMTSNCGDRLRFHAGQHGFLKLVSFVHGPLKTAEEKLLNSYFAGWGDVYKGVMLEDKGSEYIVKSMDDALKSRSQYGVTVFRQPHSLIGSGNKINSYAISKGTPFGDKMYTHTVIFRGVRFVDTSPFNSIDGGESERTVPPTILEVLSKSVLVLPPNEKIYEYTLTEPKGSAPQEKKPVPIDLPNK